MFIAEMQLAEIAMADESGCFTAGRNRINTYYGTLL
jgi:hypothetical protein